jgi:hypothetical protein
MLGNMSAQKCRTNGVVFREAKDGPWIQLRRSPNKKLGSELWGVA